MAKLALQAKLKAGKLQKSTVKAEKAAAKVQAKLARKAKVAPKVKVGAKKVYTEHTVATYRKCEFACAHYVSKQIRYHSLQQTAFYGSHVPILLIPCIIFSVLGLKGVSRVARLSAQQVRPAPDAAKTLVKDAHSKAYHKARNAAVAEGKGDDEAKDLSL